MYSDHESYGLISIDVASRALAGPFNEMDHGEFSRTKQYECGDSEDRPPKQPQRAGEGGEEQRREPVDDGAAFGVSVEQYCLQSEPREAPRCLLRHDVSGGRRLGSGHG